MFKWFFQKTSSKGLKVIHIFTSKNLSFLSGCDLDEVNWGENAIRGGVKPKF